MMEPFFQAYIAFWASACVVACALFLRRPSAFAVARHSYWFFLLDRWKWLTFLAGAALITLVAPYTGDPTWDYVDGLFMSVFCYATAPWVVATLYFAFAARRRVGAAELYVAICAWLFSASWSYDIYLVWRDGTYPSTWLANLFASSMIYLYAGLFWNLEWRREEGVVFSFMRENWPVRASEHSFPRMLGYAALLASPAIGAVLVFFL